MYCRALARMDTDHVTFLITGLGIQTRPFEIALQGWLSRTRRSLHEWSSILLTHFDNYPKPSLKNLEKKVLKFEGYLFESADTDGFETGIIRRIWANL